MDLNVTPFDAQLQRHAFQSSSVIRAEWRQPCEINAMWDSWQPHRKIMSSHLSVITSRLLQMCRTERERCLSVKRWSRRAFPRRSITAPKKALNGPAENEEKKEKSLYLVDGIFCCCWLENTTVIWFLLGDGRHDDTEDRSALSPRLQRVTCLEEKLSTRRLIYDFVLTFKPWFILVVELMISISFSWRLHS